MDIAFIGPVIPYAVTLENVDRLHLENARTIDSIQSTLDRARALCDELDRGVFK